MRPLAVQLAAISLAMAVSFSASIASPTDRAAMAMQRGDFQTALRELRPLAAKNDPNAQFMLGMLYDAGKGVPQDAKAAASWYRKAAQRKHLIAQVFLGAMLFSGQGVKQDYGEAARWFKVPAATGNDQAQFYLGAMYAKGDGVKQDDAESIRWLAKSAAQQNTRAMGMLATALFSRRRDEQDLVSAYAWSHLAAEMDPVQATTSARAVIAESCNDDQKQIGETLMAQWKRKWAADAKAPRFAR